MKTYDTYDVCREEVRLGNIHHLCAAYEGKDAFYVWTPEGSKEDCFPQMNMEDDEIKEVDDWLRDNGCKMDKDVLIHLWW